MMQVPDFIQKQLETFHDRIYHDRESCRQIRNWCVTVWLAVLTITNSNQISLTSTQKIVLPMLPIITFWILESFINTFIVLYEQKARVLERAIATGKYENSNLEQYFLLSAVESISHSRKTEQFLRSSVSETVLLFYFLLFFGTLIFQVVLA